MAYIVKYFIQNSMQAFLDSWYIQNVSIFKTRDIQDAVNL